jgi:7-keto-8-aminopelargonate synthetase-like enzyme
LDFFENKPDVLTASLAKGLAGFGGLIVADQALARVIDSVGRQNINTSHLSPLTAAQSYINLRFFRKNLRRIVDDLHDKLKTFNIALAKQGLQQYQNHNGFLHPIFSFSGRSEAQVIEIYRELLKSGITGAFFPPPVAPDPTIRFSLHRMVSEEQLLSLAEILGRFQMKPLSRQYWPAMKDIRPVHGQYQIPIRKVLAWAHGEDKKLQSLSFFGI